MHLPRFLGNYDSKNPHDTCELPTLEEPYRSKQVEIARLTKEDGVGIQRLEFVNGKLGLPRIGIVYQRKNEIALNDGLSFEDWENWFKNYDLAQPMAIIHFTKFRY